MTNLLKYIKMAERDLYTYSPSELILLKNYYGINTTTDKLPGEIAKIIIQRSMVEEESSATSTSTSSTSTSDSDSETLDDDELLQSNAQKITSKSKRSRK